MVHRIEIDVLATVLVNALKYTEFKISAHFFQPVPDVGNITTNIVF